jgi:hypothetical protein
MSQRDFAPQPGVADAGGYPGDSQPNISYPAGVAAEGGPRKSTDHLPPTFPFTPQRKRAGLPEPGSGKKSETNPHLALNFLKDFKCASNLGINTSRISCLISSIISGSSSATR